MIKGKERKGKERKGKERKGKERKGKERKGKERKGKGGFSLAAILIIVIGFISITQQKKLANATRVLETDALAGVNDILSLKDISGGAAFYARSLLSPYLTVPERAAIPEEIEPLRKKAMAVIDHFRTLPFSQTVGQEWERYLANLNRWIAANNKAITISNNLVTADIANPEQFVKDMQSIEIAHKTVLNKMADLVFLHIDFAGGESPTACVLGDWFDHMPTSNPEIVAEIERIRPIHKKFHEQVVLIKQLVAAGKMQEAQVMLQSRLMPLSEQLFVIAEKVAVISEKYHEKFEQLNTILLKESMQHQNAAFADLDDIVGKARAYAQDATERARATAARGKTITIVCMVMGTVLALLFGMLLTTMITRRLARGVDLAESMAAGDMTRTLDIKQNDEIGVLGKSLNDMAIYLRQMLTDIRQEVAVVTRSSNELAEISRQMTSGAEDTANRSSQVAGASDQMRVNQNSVAAAMEQAAVNGNMVAAATGEMQATINEISENSGRAKQITTQAVEKSQGASKRVDELGQAADEINKVTETITEISEQTNLLALNATIEAARAGEAGKGFAVVANEIKDLAGQTARATLDIQEKIQEIQRTTGITVKEINDISIVISEVDQVVATIAAAVEEQSATTAEIVNNITQVSEGISEVNQNVAQNSSVSDGIATDISEVSTRAREMTASSNEVKDMAEALSRIADKLQEMVGKFKV